jgi:DNA-binding transcriptional regulator YdaS (Cro superfamily)
MDVGTTLFAVRGAARAVAQRLGISQAAVSQWRQRGIPEARAKEVEAALEDHMRKVGLPLAPQQGEAA